MESLITTAPSPPITVYTPAKSAKARTETHSGMAGNKTCKTIAPANRAAAMSINMLAKMVKPEKAIRLLTSKRFSRNSGIVNTWLLR